MSSLIRRVFLRKIGGPVLCLYISGSDHTQPMFLTSRNFKNPQRDAAGILQFEYFDLLHHDSSFTSQA